MGGGDVRVGRSILGDAEAPGQHVSLRIGPAPDGGDGARAALTPAEARRLAGALLQQAAAGGRAADATTGQVEVSYLGGESYAVATRGHTLLTDQPATAGGADTAMTPTELLIASLSSCVTFYAGRYLTRHGLNRDGLHVTATFTTATDRPARVAAVRLTIQVPSGIPLSRQAALLAVASHCTVHNTLRQPPDIAIELSHGATEAADSAAS
jgi:uncharacterized OsmC-like protein